jgi:hypothetical protein
MGIVLSILRRALGGGLTPAHPRWKVNPVGYWGLSRKQIEPLGLGIVSSAFRLRKLQQVVSWAVAPDLVGVAGSVNGESPLTVTGARWKRDGCYTGTTVRFRGSPRSGLLTERRWPFKPQTGVQLPVASPGVL